MADTLDWMNKHLVLLRYLTVEEAVQEKYEKRPDLEELYEGVTNAETMIFKFAAAGRWKCACDLMVYVAHKRAAVWWVYKCLLSLYDEFKVNPPVDRDIADIGADFSVKVPDFVGVMPPLPDLAPLMAEAEKNIAKRQAELAEERARIDPAVLKSLDEALDFAYSVFEKKTGVHPKKMMEQALEQVKHPGGGIDPNAPLFKAAAATRAQLEAVRKETVETIKAAIPPKSPKHQKMLRDAALDAVWRWIAAPDAENSAKCFDVANTCPGTEAGLLAFSAFWSFGDLMPLGAQPVPTPPGLAPNGLVQTLMKCALAKGGTRKVAERYELYFNLGMDVLTGKENWADSLETGKAPHEMPLEAPPTAPPGTTGNSAQSTVKYERWKAKEV